MERTTKNGDKVMVHSISKFLSLGIEELISYGKEKNIKIKTLQDIITFDEASKLVEYIQSQKQKLYFDSSQWQSCSTIDEYQNLVAFIDYTLETIDTQINQNSHILEHSNDSYHRLQTLKINNSEIKEIQHYLLSKFDFSLENLKDKLIFMKSEALEFLDSVESSTSIWNDEVLSHKKIDFFFTATKIVRLYEVQMNKLKHYSATDKFFSELLQLLISLQKTDEKFQTTDKEKLFREFKESYLESYTDTIYQEWENETNKINRLYLQFIKAYFIGKISENLVLEIFAILQALKEELERFYLTIRSGIITKYQENPKSNLLQEIATKDRIFKIYQKSQPKFIALLKNESSLVAYRFVNHILGALLEFQIEEKSQGYEEIYEKMVQLHAKNLEMYLYDVEMYGKELEKRDMEISKLMFKMQTDLEKEGE